MTARRKPRKRRATKDPKGGLTAAGRDRFRRTEGADSGPALTAAAWGEPVSKTVAAARRIAAKGKRLLAAYRRKREQSSFTG